MDNTNFGTVNAGNSATSLVPGAQFPMRMDNQGAQVITPLRGKGYESSLRGSSFSVANQTGVVTTAGLATTHTGLVLSNPVGSTVNLAIGKVGIAFLVAFPAAAAIGLMVGYNATTNVTHSVAASPRNNKHTGAYTGVALADTGSTLPTAPVVHTIFGAGLTGAITTAPGMQDGVYDMEGSLLIPPGGYVAIYTSTVSGAASMLASIQWDEIPL